MKLADCMIGSARWGPPMERHPQYLTPQGLKKLEDELAQLRNVRRLEVAGKIAASHDSGGVEDNAEYEEAKNELALIEGRISEIEGVIDRAVVADKSMVEKGVIGFGSSVSVRDGTKRRRQYQIVGSAEVVPLEGKISIESPVGKALVGHRVGDVVEVETPSGVNKLTITRVR